MHLVIGGAFQGKTAYTMERFNLLKEDIILGEKATLDQLMQTKAMRHFHLWLREMMMQGEDPLACIQKILSENPDIVIITDEIGCGIVPLEPFDRKWRESVGRVCCHLAGEANTVTRVICGVPMVIKGEKR